MMDGAPPPVGLELNSPASAGVLLQGALEWAARGVPVFPCNPDPKKKNPLVAGGLNSGSIDPGQIREWWRRHPNAWVGARTGGIFDVIDLDVNKATGERIGELAVRQALPELFEAAVQVVTVSGGRHLYFRPSSGLRTWTKVAQGIDSRADGGYVIVPPSRGYAFDVGGLDVLTALPDAPAAAVKTLVAAKTQLRLKDFAETADGAAAMLTQAAELSNGGFGDFDGLDPAESASKGPKTASEGLKTASEGLKTASEVKKAPGEDDFAAALVEVAPTLGVSIEEAKRRLWTVLEKSVEYDDWLAAGQALHHEYDGDFEALALWDDWSAAGIEHGANYQDGQCAYKWGGFGRSGRGAAPRTFATVIAWTGGRKNEPTPPGEEPDWAEYRAWRDTWAYIETQHVYYRVGTNARLSAQAWKETNARFFHTVKGPKGAESSVPWTGVFLKDERAARCEKLAMAPGAAPVNPKGYNLWRAGPAQGLAKTGNPSGRAAKMFAELTLFLCGGRKEQATDLRAWAAVGVFRPAQRLLWAPLMISRRKGLGKGLWGHALALLYGDEMSQAVGQLGKLTGKFGGAYGGKMFVSVAETVDPDNFRNRFSAVEALKPLITEPRLAVELKGKDVVTVDNYTRYLFASNHLDGLKIDEDERRFFVLNLGDTEPKDAAFYAEFAALIETDAGLADVAAYLAQFQGVDVPNRAPGGDMAAMQESFKPDWLAELEAALEERGLGAVAVSAAEMRALAERSEGKVSPKWVGRVLAEHGWHNNGGRTSRPGGGRALRYWFNTPDTTVVGAPTTPSQWGLDEFDDP